MKLTEYMSITLNEKTCLSVSRRLCPKERGDILERERGDLLSQVVRTHRLELCWTDKRSEFLPSARQKLTDTNFKLIMTEEVYENKVKLLNLSEKNFIALKLKNFNDEINSFFMDSNCSKFLELREAHEKRLNEMEELKKFQSSTFDTFARRRLVEDQDTILELTGKIQELQNEINCMNDSKEFQDAESVRSGHSYVSSRPVSFPPHPIPEGMVRHSIGVPSRREGPPSIWDTHGISGNVFANPDASSSAPYPQELNPWGTTIEEPLHMSTAEKSEIPEHKIEILDASLDRQPKIQSSSVEETLQRIMGLTNKDCSLGTSLCQIPYTSHVCLLEDRIQD